MKAELDTAVLAVLESGLFIGGPNVTTFEEELARYVGSTYSVALNSGTDGLYLALRALDVGPGDEVITSPFTFAATAEAIAMCGASPVFVDVEATTLNIDVAAVESAITPHTRALLPVHLYGLPASMERLSIVARKHHLAIIEDCAQALGARSGCQHVGTLGTIGAISFFPSKNLGAYGDGGAVVTSDASLAQRVRRLRAHGATIKYYHEELGINSRLDEIQAAILRCKLPHLDEWIALRRAVAAAYRPELDDLRPVTLPPNDPEHTYHQFTIRVRDRDSVAQRMRASGVQTAVYYPVPLHLQEAFASGLRPGALPNAERAARDVLSLPIFPEIRAEEIAGVASCLRSVCAGELNAACAS